MKISKGKWLLILGVLLVVIDQVIKVIVKTHMYAGESIPVLGNWFLISFVENEGMAFGLTWGGTVGKFLLSLLRIGLFSALVWWICRLLRSSETPTGVVVGLTLIAAGALGNIFDCYFYGLLFSESPTSVHEIAVWGGHYAPFMQGKVVDMFYFPLIKNAAGETLFFRPVFNFADSCVTCGAIYLLLFQFKFFSKDEKKAE